MPDPGAPGHLTLSEDDRRILAPWAADCAERALGRFEAAAPADPRPREAIAGLRAFAGEELGVGPVRVLAAAAHAAARDVAEPAAVAAARAAGQAAATAHMAAHAWAAAAYAARAAGLAAPAEPAAPGPSAPAEPARAAGRGAIAREVRWQLERASPEVRDTLRRLPSPPEGGGELGLLMRELQEGILAEG